MMTEQQLVMVSYSCSIQDCDRCSSGPKKRGPWQNQSIAPTCQHDCHKGKEK